MTTVITEHYLVSVVAKAGMHTDDELTSLVRFCDDRLKETDSVEEQNVFAAFARFFEASMVNPPKRPVTSRPQPAPYAGPKPKFKNHCNHPPEDYAGEFEGADLYFYLDNDSQWSYCLRRSDTDLDYLSSWVINLAHETPVTYGYPATDDVKLEHSDHDLALLHRFFKHTQAHRCR